MIKWGMPIVIWRGCTETFGKNLRQRIAAMIAPNIGGNFFENRKKKERARKTSNGIPLSKGFFTTEPIISVPKGSKTPDTIPIITGIGKTFINFVTRLDNPKRKIRIPVII
jgi:hypothetical protein